MYFSYIKSCYKGDGCSNEIFVNKYKNCLYTQTTLSTAVIIVSYFM